MHDVCGFLQVQRVEHRVTEKKSQAVRFEQELSHAQLMANRGTKRKTNPGGLLVSYTDGRHIYSFISVWLKSGEGEYNLQPLSYYSRVGDIICWGQSPLFS